MDDTSAQVTQNRVGNTQQTNDQPAVQPQVIPTQASQPVSVAVSKEHAPLTEHIQISDPAEAMPEVRQELKEYGVEVKQDEARLELTRAHHNAGIQHAPSAAPIAKHLTEQKLEFPMTYEAAEISAKKGSVLNSIRWLATLVLKQMKIKRVVQNSS